MLNKEPQTFPLTETQSQYLEHNGFRTNDLKFRLRQKTYQDIDVAKMLGNEFQGDLITQLLKTMNAHKAIEVGVFTGYTTLCIAQGLDEQGKVYGLDISSEWASVGRPFWEEAGVDRKIELVIGNALTSLDRLIDEGHSGTFDFAFIDAEKTEYPEYYERILVLLRQGGSMLIDNCLWHWDVADISITDPKTVALRRINQIIRHDPRVMSVLLPMADGSHFVTKI